MTKTGTGRFDHRPAPSFNSTVLTRERSFWQSWSLRCLQESVFLTPLEVFAASERGEISWSKLNHYHLPGSR